MGESAGGISVVHLLAWAVAHGLFQWPSSCQAAVRTYGVRSATVARAEQTGLDLAKSMEVSGTGAEALAALRALPLDR